MKQQSEIGKLSMEQQFQLRRFSDQVGNLSKEQAQEFLVELYKHMLSKENFYKHFLKQEWGLDSSPFPAA
ncbi:Phycobilisome degradation protein nblA [Gloeothece citriformis PCC 7424]|uniref:Phycobilisome degradation protein nblA n=1 Tax=Gloeothece citriformis (strain PCC 7424) TaxID=65393 RepID=B7KCK5_GLOC7|nr:NblA/ycf18 family protein [Gloeothece citriformis]ACK71556.1 Phycobilisome degradation protein nblA [Gloeothece citriformis PCC 7424]